MKYLIGLLAMLLPILSGAQAPPVKALTIGDMVPDIAFNNVTNYKNTTAKLSDFEGKLIILDFWSSWCGSCIALFPHMDSLQKEFGKNLQIILVNTKSKMTNDDEPKIKKTLERVRTRTGISLNMPVVYNSEKLDDYFPCITIPHEVWINKDMKVIGITSADEVISENIANILNGRDVTMKLKKDRFGVDFQSPLFMDGNGGDGSETLYRSIVTNYLDGINGRSGIWHKDHKAIGLYLINQSLSSITEMIYADEMVKNIKMIHSNRIVMDVRDKRKFDTKNSDSFYYQNLFSYELMVPPATDSAIFEYARQDLKRYFNISVKYELRNMKCLVLTAPGGIDGLKNTKKEAKDLDLEKSSLKKYIHNYPPQFIIGLLNSYLPSPLIDETNITKDISVDLPFHLNDLTGLKKSFLQAGLSLKEENRMLEVIVITDK